MGDYSHLWNDLPYEQRMHLMPYQIQSQILHLTQARELIVRRHKAELAELDKWIANCKEGLERQVNFNQSKGGNS